MVIPAKPEFCASFYETRFRGNTTKAIEFLDYKKLSPSIDASHFLNFPLFKQMVDPERRQFFGH
jgi:hypothetical protein